MQKKTITTNISMLKHVLRIYVLCVEIYVCKCVCMHAHIRTFVVPYMYIGTQCMYSHCVGNVV